VTETAREIVAHFLGGAGDPTGTLSYRLLEQFHDGLPVEHVLPLLRSEYDEAARIGAWITCELASRAKPLLSLLGEFLEHRSPSVRFWIIGSLINCVDGKNWPAILAVGKHLMDSSDAVRWQAMSFFTHISRDVLSDAHVTIDSSSTDPEVLNGIRLLCREFDDGCRTAESWLRSGSVLQQSFATCFAARHPPHGRSLLQTARRCWVLAIRNYATDQLSRKRWR
jgi:hypothetical protein